MVRFNLLLLALAVLLLPACDTNGAENPGRSDLPSIDPAGLEQVLNDGGGPTVVNVWASWCIPCRSEAPLLNAAASKHSDEIRFIGIDVQDSQSDAKAFLAEFGLDFPHYFDPSRVIPQHYAAIGTPITFFFDSQGDLVSTHLGVIDDRALAIGIDELIRKS